MFGMRVSVLLASLMVMFCVVVIAAIVPVAALYAGSSVCYDQIASSHQSATRALSFP